MYQLNNDGLTVLILAGGFGTRLSKVLADRPKALAEVNGRPFITYIFDQLIDAGLNNIIVCTGYMSEKIVATIGNNYKNIKILYSKEEIPLGTAGAARRAALYVSNKTMMIMNGDSYINTDFKEFINWHSQHDSFPSILLTKVQESNRYGNVILKSNKIVSFSEKTDYAKNKLINAGVYLIPTEKLSQIEENSNISFEKELFPKWAKNGWLYGFYKKAEFIDIGTPESLKEAQSFFSKINN